MVNAGDGSIEVITNETLFTGEQSAAGADADPNQAIELEELPPSRLLTTENQLTNQRESKILTVVKRLARRTK